jgi:hypothetical protein
LDSFPGKLLEKSIQGLFVVFRFIWPYEEKMVVNVKKCLNGAENDQGKAVPEYKSEKLGGLLGELKWKNGKGVRLG